MTDVTQENENLDTVSTEGETDLHEQQAEQEQADALRDAQAAQMAKELGLDDDEQDFNPDAIPQLSPEQEAQMLKGTQDILQTAEGAEMAAVGAIDWYEELLQEHGHERFSISDKKKERGAKRLTPVIQKYAPEMLGLFGQYKSEVMAALFVGSMAYGSVKQIKALKAEDLAEDKRLHPEKYKQPETETSEAA